MEVKDTALQELNSKLSGDLQFDQSIRLMYATDASAYRELPRAVSFPRTKEDIVQLIDFATANNCPLIPRAAGTSLAGQVVGNGIIVDVSRYMTSILEFNKEERWVWVEPGVVLDELNQYLEAEGLFFGPETSTSNRCTLGGMLGNNACGAHSIVYGSTREHTLEVKALLSDTSEAHFRSLSKQEMEEKLLEQTLEAKLYEQILDRLGNKTTQQEILEAYPDKDIKRRNTGYALDLLLDSEAFSNTSEAFNFCKLLAGSEGTLAFTTAIKLNLEPLPPPHKALVCVHLESVAEATLANLLAIECQAVAIELMDDSILELTKDNIKQNQNRFFIKGNPGAILIIEFAEHSEVALKSRIDQLTESLKAANYGYHYPVVRGNDIQKVWKLRKAGLGVLSNMAGDAKPVAVTEDTAVHPRDLPEYIAEFASMMEKHGKSCTYHAHIATGELHLRPVLNLKDTGDIELFHKIAQDSALLVKKYNGSLSGEHGDGRLRGEFIPLMYGERIYELLRDVKRTWDPQGIFNPGKITDTPKMNQFLRYEAGQQTRSFDTYFDYSKEEGLLRAVEKCNGAAACRKTELIGGTMCPSYMGSRDERQTTRARANVLREFLTHSHKSNPFDHQEIYEVMDLCLSCKACKSECPSSVDVAKLKAEFLQQYYQSNGIPLRTRVIANISSLNRMGSLLPALYNWFNSNALTSGFLAKGFGFAHQRKFPLLSGKNLKKWHDKNQAASPEVKKRVYLFNDEFTRFNDTEIGMKAILLLKKLGYEVLIPKHMESARTFLSKGMLKKARRLAEKNVSLLHPIITEETPLIGIEPSALLGFRDEYPELVRAEYRESAKELARNCFLIDEFLEQEIDKGHIEKEMFTTEAQHIKLHGHCHQKSLASTHPSLTILNFPKNYQAEEIPSGCCGMAGSFGFEKEHYDLSMKIGELVLFPAVREVSEQSLIAAPGTSCRHQIKDGTQRTALHPVEILFDALK